MLQIGIREWFTPRTRWAVCVGHACMLVACVYLPVVFHVILSFRHVGHGCSKVIMMNLM